jgi:hypothetical protein
VFDPCTSVPVINRDILRLELNPNPADNIVNITVKGLNRQARITVTGIDGISHDSFVIEPSGQSIVRQVNLTGYSKGVYIVRLKTADQLLTEKLVIR